MLWLGGAWAILPPLYFFFEHWILDEPDEKLVEFIHRGGDLAMKCWAAVGAVLFFLLSRK